MEEEKAQKEKALMSVPFSYFLLSDLYNPLQSVHNQLLLCYVGVNLA